MADGQLEGDLELHRAAGGVRRRLTAHPLFTHLVRALRVLLILAVITAVGYAVARDWTAVTHTFSTLSPISIALSLAAAVAALFATVKVWQQLLSALGSELHGSHAAQIFLTGQLARYLPGTVWAFFLQAHLGRRHEVPRTRSFLAVLLAVEVSTATGLALSVVAVPDLVKHWGPVAWLLMLGPVALIGLVPRVMTFAANQLLRILRRPQLPEPIPGRRILFAAGWSFLAWLLFGVHLFVLLHAVHSSAGGGAYAVSTSTFALAVCAGFVAFVLPSGVGVREAVIVAGLTTNLTSGAALAIALISRLICTAGDVLAAVLAEIASRITHRTSGDETKPGSHAPN